MASDSEIDDLKERVASACRVIGRLGLTREPAGHVSVRIPGTDRILIKARGPQETGLRFTTVDDVVMSDLEGNPIDAPSGLSTPGEVKIHTAILKRRPGVNSVIHVHPPTVVVFTVVGKPLLPILGAYDPAGLRLALEGIPLFDKSVLVSTDALGEELADTIGEKEVVMMRGHGITTVAPTIEGAGLNVVVLNDLAEMNYKAHMLGEPRPISDEDIATFVKIRKRTGVAGGGAAWETARRSVDD